MKSVLIVDDEKSIRVSLREFLVDEGYRVEIAADAAEALKLLGDNDFDVVVSDIVLPRVTGIELLKAIRGAAPFAQMIIMTGDPTVATAAEALRAGAFDYLTKPVGKDALLRAVSSASKVKAIDDERRRLDHDNRRYQETLEDLVRERTLSLQQALDELKQTQQRIIQQERLKALGQMVSGIAHDFNNVLMPIMGLPEFLLSAPERLQNKDVVTKALEDILSAAKDAREIVRRLREFYRPTDDLEVHSVDLQALVRQAIALTEPAWKAQAEATGKTIRIETDALAAPVVATVNESGLREVLINLIMNAVDAIAVSGTIRLALSEDGDGAVLKVSDSGGGMSEEVRQHCFEPFYSTKGEHGTGLGLAVCYGIVQRHGGRVEVASVMGQGTTFTILLPRTRLTSPGVEPAHSDSSSRSQARLKILVVDDEVVSRALVGSYLEAAGHDVAMAENGRQALQMLADGGVDLVVTDRAMPGMGGDELARAVKRASPGMPVLMLTGFGDLMKYKAEHPAGVDAIIGKPVTPGELNQAVQNVMAERGLAPREMGRGHESRPTVDGADR